MTLELFSPEETIRALQVELTETNREVLALTVELEKRVEERTAALRATQEDLRQKNADLLKQTLQLEAANKDLESFSYSVSHDLRAPLRHIDAYLQMLIDGEGTALSSAAHGYLGKIGDAVRRMNQLIEDLLAFSRTGRAEMEHARIDMSELVSEVLREMSPDLAGRNIEWRIQRLPRVEGDRALLKQVWMNLLSNAVKYTRPRNPARIEVGCLERPSEFEFYVQDNGVGFDMRYVSRMFGVFQRFHSAAEFEGTGIGLASVRAIVGRHGGRTSAEGQLNAGATVHFTLPKTSS